MTGKRRSKTIYSSNESSDESNGLDSDHSDEFQLKGNEPAVKSEIKPRKRGRGPSKRPCQNRNAMMARVNRQKKKEYVEKIEKKLSSYRDEHKSLKSIIEKQDDELQSLREQVAYLKNILNNNTTITTLLRAMNEVLRSKKHREVNNDREAKVKANISLTGINFNDLALALESEPSDHTYSYPGVSHSLFDFEGVNCDSSTSFTTFVPSDASNDQLDTKPSPSLVVDTVDLGVTDQDIEQLAMDNNIFESIADGDINAEPIDFIRPDDASIDTANLFENLDNSGVCVHVNSGRISLEFCSVCHLNSINSDDP